MQIQLLIHPMLMYLFQISLMRMSGCTLWHRVPQKSKYMQSKGCEQEGPWT